MATANIIERAYELAKSGNCATIVEIERTLSREQYLSVAAHMASPTLRRELTKMCRAAIAEREAGEAQASLG